MMNKILASGFREMKLSYDGKAIPQLEDFAVRVLETNQYMNLTAIVDPDEFARKHYLDCASLLCTENFAGKKVIDVGCGAGFPGMPIKILQPDMKLTLLDSLQKRIRFLQECIDGMELIGVNAVHARAEEYAVKHREEYDIAVSRAVARLNVLAELTLPMVKVGGVFIAMKSKECEQEVNESKHALGMLGAQLEGIRDYRIPGTEITHSLVIIRKVKATPKQFPRRFNKITASPL